ncbi:hypothetical protein FNH22_24460 [Fulvivirga sp. M361]|uniref:hypothetical protein n=1 Tax=Fulvivirga sp. M361 TaxID=2594266 RepID=UPI001179F0B6|nr:hypothetical protein [Fulvivirga sp. M361]TRX51291.1 hypothetical protein FNH22_24460 [Fulvivirga sp. M361]
MKNLAKTSSILAMAIMIFAASVNTYADNRVDKTVEKARSIITDCSPDDWESYAKAADMCIRKQVNLTEAKTWLDKSLTIKESALGHEVAGDYYMSSKLYKKAADHYIKSMMKIKEKDNSAQLSDLQAKVNNAIVKSKE